MKILVVEHNSTIRMVMCETLTVVGHHVVEAEDGLQAFQLLQNDDTIQLVVTGWQVPSMNGIQLCQQIRAYPFTKYVYIIMVIARNDKLDMITAMDNGADDVIEKPLDPSELDVRVRAGQRIVELESALSANIEAINKLNQDLSIANHTLQTDLECAAELQRSLLPKLPEANEQLPRTRFGSLFLPCTGVAGDIFNFFLLQEQVIGFYHLDVSGHGIPSAMLSVSLNKMISPSDLLVSKKNPGDPTQDELRKPDEVITILNSRFQCPPDNMIYFTMVYGLLNTETGELDFCQAGHPNPVHIGRSGVSLIGKNGFPVGMFPDLDYESVHQVLEPGDRIIFYSDGVTECSNPEREMFSETRLLSTLERESERPIDKLLENVNKDLTNWHNSNVYEDDVSILAMEWLAPSTINQS